MDKLIDILLGSFDFGYMLSVNVLTYLIIKAIDAFNGDAHVPTWLKRTIAVLCGILIGGVVAYFNGYTNIILYSFILSLISWDMLFKPVIKKFEKIDYKKLKDEINI